MNKQTPNTGFPLMTRIISPIATILMASLAMGCLTTKHRPDNRAGQATGHAPHIYGPASPGTTILEPPEEVLLCGERVPLQDPDVRERFEREFYLMLGDYASTIMWIKRSNRYFPMFEEALEANDLCDDLKYLAVIESNLRPAARSSAGALGLWQFMRPTGREMGLEIKGNTDERRAPDLSTDAAMDYLKYLHKRFHNWPLAMAAYNLGPNGLARRMQEQKVDNYYDLILPSETARYVFRIAAAKAVMENRAQYGYAIKPDQLYQPAAQQKITLQVPREGLPLSELASIANVKPRTLRLMNSHHLDGIIPGGTQTINIPSDLNPDQIRLSLMARGKAGGTQGSQTSGGSTTHHKIKSGETLLDIAKQFNVSFDDLVKANSIQNPDKIHPGQILRIPQ